MPELPEVEAWRRQLDPLVKRSPIEKAGPAHIATLKTIEPPLSALDGEGYLIDAFREVRVGGRPVNSTEQLTDGSRIEIGSGVKLQMRRAHPLSLTARLDFLSRHRTQPPADAVLLLADACVLGPQPHSHIICRDWTREVIIFRHDEKLFCHATGRFEIDGVACKNRGPLQANSRVSGDGFSFSLEPLHQPEA